MRVGLLGYNCRHADAIGQQVAEKLAFFLDRGADVRVFVEEAANLHPEVASYCRVIDTSPVGEGWDFLSRADLVCVEFGQYYSLLGLLPFLAGTKARILVDYHGITPPEWWGGHNREALVKGLSYRGLVWNAGLTMVHSQFMEQELLDVTGIPPQRLRRLGFPIDSNQFHPSSGDNFWRKELGLEECRVLLFVGRLAPNKRVDMLVEVLNRLGNYQPPVHALIVGHTGDLYCAEAERCRHRAGEFGLAGRLHFLGPLSGQRLREAYQAADILVVPSRWESFCLPVIEAMACGVPVVASRAGALPETVGNAGLTFTTDNVDDLARQVRRVLDSCHGVMPNSPAQKLRVGMVAFRWGTGFAGGAEWSLRRMAQVLHQAGHEVEVLTTCNRHESQWKNELPEGTTFDGDIPVHRFRMDNHDREQHLETVHKINDICSRSPLASGRREPPEVPPELEESYLRNSIHSSDLISALRDRPDLDAIIVGPYLFGLTMDVAQAFTEKTLLLPCFHDEPLARLDIWRKTYERVGGILYHSTEEHDLAHTMLGLNHPGSVVVGTWMEGTGDSASGGQRSPGLSRSLPSYLVYCGRYSRQKDLPRLLDFAHQFNRDHPGRFRFVFMGHGEVAIPNQPWAEDLGFVDEERKRELLRGASALVQLSSRESLSLVALESWDLGTPVIASRSCPVMAAHVEASEGGALIDDYPSFARVLHDLWDHPREWRRRGERGREYVRDRYGSRLHYLERLQRALDRLKTPLGEQMRQRGLERAISFYRSSWRQQFARVVEEVLDSQPEPERLEVNFHFPQNPLILKTSGEAPAPQSGQWSLLSVRLTNRGNHALFPEETILYCRPPEPDAQTRVVETPLPEMLLPGRTQSVAVPLPVPSNPGNYQIQFWVGEKKSFGSKTECPGGACGALLDLCVEAGTRESDPIFLDPLLEPVRTALARAQQCAFLPDSYLDISEGWFARTKRWLKKKFLNNFKRAYVDVLSHQQTQCNQQLLRAIQELADFSATLHQVMRGLHDRIGKLEKEEGKGRNHGPEKEFKKQAI